MIIEGRGMNPKYLTLLAEKFQTHVEIWNLDGVECVLFKEMVPVEAVVELGNYLEKVRLS